MDDDIIDGHCDPKKPHEVSFDDITTADLLLMDEVTKTPCTVMFREYSYIHRKNIFMLLIL